MRIDETKTFTFHLPFQNGIVSLNVPAPSQKEAAQYLKDWLEQAQKELALLFPRVAPSSEGGEVSNTLNQLQIGLIGDMVAKIPGYEGQMDYPALAKAVKKLTKLELNVDNFKEILPLLDKQKNG